MVFIASFTVYSLSLHYVSYAIKVSLGETLDMLSSLGFGTVSFTSRRSRKSLFSAKGFFGIGVAMVHKMADARASAGYESSLFRTDATPTGIGKLLRSKLWDLSVHFGMPQVLNGPNGNKTLVAPTAFQPPSSPQDIPTQIKAVAPSDAITIIERAMAGVPAKGECVIPKNVEAAAALLSHLDALNDLQALDYLQSAFPRSTRRSKNRVILAIARAVTESFGTANRLPLTSMCAWSMLDAEVFTDEFAAQFTIISTFILGWQSDKKDFLLLDPSEVSLIELMFESLHPRKQGLLAAKVMDFKVMSNRRLGLIRRIPNRVEQILTSAAATGTTETAIQYAKDCLALLDHIARPEGFAPIIEEAKISAGKIVKTVQRVMAPPAQPALPPPDGQTPVQAAAPAIAPPQNTVSTNAVTTTPPKRLTKRHRTEAAIRYLRGENPDLIAQSLGVKAAAIEGWAEAFLAGGASALASREKNDTPDQSHADTAEMDDLKSRVEHLTKLVQALTQDSNRTD